jgi:ubiquinone/menaquinone biosynthesis C-methylase UbiE/uncharacterized protein YbaR (Trm112 family)
MNYELLNLLKCPLTKSNLKFELISEFKKLYDAGEVNEIYEGLLFSEAGFVFPIIKGIPRMLIESIYDYSDFLKKYLEDYNYIKNKLEKNYPGLLNYCFQKNKRTKKSFEFEWSFLKAEKRDQIWHDDQSKLSTIFINEVGESYSYFNNKSIIDIGSGHGLMTTKIAELSNLCVGVELSNAVENAYLRNRCKKAWYIQGDLQFLPFNDNHFDVIYSSGVIHHTNNTELSLSFIEGVLKNSGKICLWLYHPQKSLIHNFTLEIRRVTSKLPLKIAFAFIAAFIFPFTFLYKKIKNRNAPNFREEIVDLLDSFTPEFRFEIPHDLAIVWLQRRCYKNIKVTTSNEFGFSISADKNFLK